MDYFVTMMQQIIGLALQAFSLFLQLIIWVLTFAINAISQLFGAIF